jgi:peptide/nickel transport system permease protein
MSIKRRVSKFKARMKPTVKEIKLMITKIKETPLSIIGVVIISFYVVVALFCPILAPPGDPSQGGDPYRMPHKGWSVAPSPPTEKNLFGTTAYGFDIYYGCIWGTRIAFYIGALVVGISLVIGISVGTISGYYGGVVQEILMRITDIVYALPGLVLAMALVVALGRSLTNVLIALSLVRWPNYARVLRSEILKVKQEDYVEAAKAIGCSDLRVIIKHILPNCIYSLLVMATLDIGSVVLIAAALSFLGLGSSMGFTDWGQIINSSRDWLTGVPGNTLKYWYTFTIPGIFIFTFVLGWNLLGDAFRDILDPRLRRL